jgi:hypothetical protein
MLCEGNAQFLFTVRVTRPSSALPTHISSVFLWHHLDGRSWPELGTQNLIGAISIIFNMATPFGLITTLHYIHSSSYQNPVHHSLSLEILRQQYGLVGEMTWDDSTTLHVPKNAATAYCADKNGCELSLANWSLAILIRWRFYAALTELLHSLCSRNVLFKRFLETKAIWFDLLE